MRQRRRVVSAIITFTLIGVLSLLAVILPGGARAGATGMIAVTGTVVDSAGSGVQDVSVTATDPGGSTVDFGPTNTGADGTYELDVNAGTYDFHFDPPSGSGLTAVVDSNVTVLNNQTINVQFTPATYVVSGKLTDSAGNPLANVAVVVTASDGNRSSTGTDSSGNYSMAVTPDTYSFSVVGGIPAPDDSLGTTRLTAIGPPSVDLTTHDVTQNLVLNTATIHVTVLDGNGQPVPNSEVVASDTAGTAHLYSTDPGETISSNGNTVTTGSDGTIDLTAIVGAQFGTTQANSICADISSSQVCLAAPLTVTGNTDVVIQAPSTNTISGRLTDSAGNPLANVAVVVTASDGNRSSTGTDSNGDYSISVTPDTYSFSVVGQIPAPDDSLGTTRLTASGTDSVNATSGNVSQNLTLNTATIGVTVLDGNGNPVPNADVLATGAAGTAHLYSTDPGETISSNGNTVVTNAEGTTSLTSIVGTQYGTTTANSICADISGNQVCLTEPMTVTGNANIVIQETPTTHTISGRLTDSAGNPLANIAVFVTASDGSRSSTGTDSSGNYSMAVTPDTYSFNIVGQIPDPDSSLGTTRLTATGSNSVDATSGNVTQNLTLNTAQLHVTVLDGNGQPVPNADVLATGAGGTAHLYSTDPGETISSNGNTVTTGSDGTADLTSIVGTQYGTTTANSICADISSSQVCLAAPLTVTGNTDVVIQEAPTISLNQAINAGGGATGNFAADSDFSGGTTYSSTASVDTSGVTNPAPQSVYQTVRYGNSMSYTLPGLTPGANYTLRLDFNELYWGVGNNGGGVGSRVFNVAVNGQSALSNFDIYEVAGGANKALTEQIPATADANGNITIQFTSVTDNAMVSGIELYNGTLPPLPPNPPTIFSTVINAGGDTEGNFVADTDFSGGTTYSSTASVDTSGVTNPAPQGVYQTVRYGNFSYTIPQLTPNNNYLVRLHFNELYWGTGNNGGGVGSRVFNVAINGSQVLSNFDIYATAGGANKAVVEDFTVPADANGKITIQFTSVVDNAMVSGIEIDPAQ